MRLRFARLTASDAVQAGAVVDKRADAVWPVRLAVLVINAILPGPVELVHETTVGAIAFVNIILAT